MTAASRLSLTASLTASLAAPALLRRWCGTAGFNSPSSRLAPAEVLLFWCSRSSFCLIANSTAAFSSSSEQEPKSGSAAVRGGAGGEGTAAGRECLPTPVFCVFLAAISRCHGPTPLNTCVGSAYGTELRQMKWVVSVLRPRRERTGNERRGGVGPRGPPTRTARPAPPASNPRRGPFLNFQTQRGALLNVCGPKTSVPRRLDLATYL
jgi:hypothetical protein